MTILVSTVFQKLIVMLSDSTITTTHFTDDQGNYFNEYESGSKYYRFPGVGCITTWGDHTYNRLGAFLQKQRISPSTHSVNDLADLTYKYIVEEYRKDEHDELGFHIGGFGRDNRPHLYHAFWGFDRPKPKHQLSPKPDKYDHSDWVFLYNGHNDLADTVIGAFKKQLESGQETRFNIKTFIGRICLCDFIARFAAEVTPEVGPPFVMHLVFADNSIEKIENNSFSPISLQAIAPVLPRLLQDKSNTPPPSSPPNRPPPNPSDYCVPTGTGASTLLSDNPTYYGGTANQNWQERD